MGERTTPAMTNRMARNAGGSRGTVREFDDNHLVQQIKYADVFHSETTSDFERFQPVGLTSVPLKQEQKKQAQQNQQGEQQPQSSGGQPNISAYGGNANQPTGKAAEVMMNYMNGSRSHPVGGLTDDERVRPYAMKEGESAMYAVSGTGQMLFHNDSGSYLVATNNPPEQSQDNQNKERFASLRHVSKQKQPRQIQKGQTPADPHHEGETVNTEVRCTSGRIEFRVGSNVVGYYDGQSSKWSFTGEMRLGDDNASDPVYGVNSGKGMTTKLTGAGAVLVTAPNPGPPTSMDNQPLIAIYDRIAELEARIAALEGA
jgi:phage gp45-like